MRHALRLAVVAAGCAMASGCVNWTKPLAPHMEVAQGAAYLYGRFKVDAPKAFLGMDGHQTIGLVLQCSDGGKYTVRFSREQPLQLIQAAPATCTLVNVLFTNADGQVLSTKPPPSGLLQHVVLSAARAHYLGDFHGTASVSYGVFEWRLDGVSDNFDATTAEVRLQYPRAAGLQFVNALAPADP